MKIQISNMFLNRKFIKSILMLVYLALSIFFASPAHSQAFIKRATWDGPYDIRMIAAPNLEAVFINPAEAANSKIKKESVISYNTILMTAGLMNINNDFTGGSPFKTYNIPEPALLCPDPNIPCYQGLIVDDEDPTPACPVFYDNKPNVVSKTVAITYADYDTDMATFSSSMAKLDISACAEIESAYLYWTGSFKNSDNISLFTPTPSYNGTGNVFDVTPASNFRTVRFKTPGGAYQTITAPAAVPTITTTGTRIQDNTYVCVADVTPQVQQVTGGGEFWVGNILSYPQTTSGGSKSGWVLVVVFRSPLSPPRLISLFDGLVCVNGKDPDAACPSSTNIILNGLTTPSTTNFKSYVGFATLDGENLGTELIGKTPEGLGFKTGGATFNINPFCDGSQPKYHLWDKNGSPATSNGDPNLDACSAPLFNGSWALVCDGISSSHITSYDELTDKNGNEIVRLPNNKNTLGLDVHHIKLPPGAVTPGATSATLTVEGGPQGGSSPFLAYIAIERLQPKLEMSKFADKNSAALNTSITYTLRIRNKGNSPSLGGDRIYDTLDIATDYSGPITSKRYVNGVVTAPAPGVSLVSSTGDNLEFLLASPILMNDSIDIIFNVLIKPYASNEAIWRDACKRSILNTAWVKYNTIASGILVNKSNSSDCGIGTETRVLIFDASLNTSAVTAIGPFDGCALSNTISLPDIRSRVMGAGVASNVIDEFDIRTDANVRVNTTDKFPASISALSYFAYRDYAAGGNCQQIYEIKYGCIAPVKWLEFSGWKDEAKNILTWTTASEVNNNYFSIERSADGVNFISIGTLAGNGNSDYLQYYRFEDEKPLEGTSYYRLKQVDHDGAAEYSKVIAVTNNQAADIQIYPNPNNGKFTISILAPDQAYALEITDLTGKVVYEKAGETIPPHVEIENLAQGVYLVQFSAGDKFVVKKLLVY